MAWTPRLVAALALAPFEALYGLLAVSPGAIVASSILYVFLPAAAGAAALRERLAPRAGVLLLASAALKAILIASTPSEPLHYAADTMAALSGALAAAESRGGRVAVAALAMVAAGSLLVALKAVPGAALAGLALQAAGLLAAGASMQARARA